MLFSFLFIKCSKDEDAKPAMNSEEVRSTSNIDDIADDVLQIAESQSNKLEIAMRYNGTNFLGGCATISTVENENTWVRTIDFGETNCTLFNGNEIRGKIILTFNNDWDAATRTVLYSFDGFYHNDRHVEGNKTVVKTVLPNGHPNAVITLDMTVTTADGAVYTRTGIRVREFTEGYDTVLNFFDNVYAVTGSWTTVLPSGTIHVATITAPIVVKWNCTHLLLSGTIVFTRSLDDATASLDYGNGACDGTATITINGMTYTINF